MERINAWKAAVTAAIGCLTALWGWMGWLIIGWIGLMALDYITGSVAAAKNGSWASNVAREGAWHKVGMVIVVAVAIGTDLLIATVLEHLPLVQLPFEYTGLICPLIVVWYCVTELGSIGENAVIMGAPVPGWLLKILDAGKRAVDEAGEKLAGDSEKE